MSDLQNPLFDEEKEFLERKKLEYERALRGDVEHIKDQSVMVGKVAMVGAGLIGSIWLIAKALGGKKHKRAAKGKAGKYDPRHAADHDERESDHDYEFGTGYFSSGKPYDSAASYKSAADSARVFNEHHEHTHEADDLGFGSTAATPVAEHPEAYIKSYSPEPADQHEQSGYDPEEFEDDPFQDLPYDDSRRLPTSHAFDDNVRAPAASSRSRMIGSVLQAFLQSDTGKMLVAQTAAVALALVTKKVSEFFPATKNSDLAASPAPASAEYGFSPVASSASPVPSDASYPPQSL
ncbi:hypothetical protein [Hymenobacter terricola]|uniref:hypothetical protein n=1 Tax=Hymenobacter terricola TaxID=2819236 RepID=UPI001B30C105|nr:hypothetical protein [Hymenobacter terricola]